MTAIDRRRVAKLLAEGDHATTTTARGRALEELIVYFFELMPGASVTARNVLNAFQAEEIDVAFWNEGDPTGLRMFDHILLVECKNWTTSAGYPVAQFLPMAAFPASSRAVSLAVERES